VPIAASTARCYLVRVVRGEDVSEVGTRSHESLLGLAPEEALWEGSVRGEPDARSSFAALIEHEVARHLARLGARHQEREDLVAEVQTQVLEWLAVGRERPRNILGFLRYRALGAFTAHVRRRRRRLQELEPAAALRFFASEVPEDPSPIDVALDLEECKKRLPVDQRELVEARYAQGRTLAEVAQSYERAIVWVHRTLQRALEALRLCLERERGSR